MKIFPFYQKYTISLIENPKTWVNLEKCDWRKKAIPRCFTKVNLITLVVAFKEELNNDETKHVSDYFQTEYSLNNVILKVQNFLLQLEIITR